MKDWNINESQHGVLVHDNASSMVKAARLAKLDDLCCYIHTMQLVVKDGLEAQHAIIDTVFVARILLGHFWHSIKATEKAYKSFKSSPEFLFAWKEHHI